MIPTDLAQRVVLAYLLEQHPAMQGFDDLAIVLPDREALELAVSRLSTDGLVSRLGNRVGLTQAAVRMDELKPA